MLFSGIWDIIRVSQKPLEVAEYDTGPMGNTCLSELAGGAMQDICGFFHFCIQLTEMIVNSHIPRTALLKTDKLSKLKVLKGTIWSLVTTPGKTKIVFEPQALEVCKPTVSSNPISLSITFNFLTTLWPRTRKVFSFFFFWLPQV